MFFILLFGVSFIYASDYDKALVDTLKIEANHNIERLKSYKKEKLNNRIFENEREKGLGEFLEEQEKWDLIRERGRQEYRKQKLSETQEINRKEYERDLKEKLEERQQYEYSRRVYVKTRDKVRSQQNQTVSQLESEELEFYMNRPRYEFNKRHKNKWIAAGGSKPSTGSGSSGYQGGITSPAVSDYPQNQTEFPPAPAPAYEGFEEVPPPPLYDSNMNSNIPYDPSFGGDVSIPPPPPPPLDYDF